MRRYDELEKEYAAKKHGQQELENKGMKVNTLAAELAGLRAGLRAKEALIAAFKRDLSGLVLLRSGKDVEDAVKAAYQKYVKEERPRNPKVGHLPRRGKQTQMRRRWGGRKEGSS